MANAGGKSVTVDSAASYACASIAATDSVASTASSSRLCLRLRPATKPKSSCVGLLDTPSADEVPLALSSPSTTLIFAKLNLSLRASPPCCSCFAASRPLTWIKPTVDDRLQWYSDAAMRSQRLEDQCSVHGRERQARSGVPQHRPPSTRRWRECRSRGRWLQVVHVVGQTEQTKPSARRLQA